jgi:hypothetical protein
MYEVVKNTGPAKPLMLETVTVVALEDPTVMLRLLGAAVRPRPKNENFTMTACVNPCSPAVTVTVKLLA